MPIMGRKWALFIILFLITFHHEVFAKKKVCVIGAGRAGLAAIKLVADLAGKFEPIGFERNSDVGGLWIYREDPDFDENRLPAHSGIYKNLKTLTIKDFMVYPDYKNFGSSNSSDFVSHETFLKYMRNYADHFRLRKYIQFNTLVTRVTPFKDKKATKLLNAIKCTRGTTRWLVHLRNLKTYEDDVVICDGVIVCNGRYSKPIIPKIPGIVTFPGKVLHSRSYRRPEYFKNKTVIILGAQASGTGISRDLSPYAKTVYLSHRRKHRMDGFPANVIDVRAVVKFDRNQFILEDGSKITADALIYCTGYAYDFPFLDEESGIEFDEKHIYHLEHSFVNKKYPSMVLIGLGNDDGFPDLYYLEVEYFLKSLQTFKQLSYDQMLIDSAT